MTSPAIDQKSFRCPLCKTFAHQQWYWVKGGPIGIPPVHPTINSIKQQMQIAKQMNNTTREQYLLDTVDSESYCGPPHTEQAQQYEITNLYVARCHSCRRISIWQNGRMVHPSTSVAEEPSTDMPQIIRPDFEEARAVLAHSPRASAALLRLCIQKLCIQFGGGGKDINADIGQLVKDGLTPSVQQALDIVRVVGNESVHPGQINLNDDMPTAVLLFSLVNMIVTEMITRPKQIKELYDKLPEGKRKGIEDRDKR